MKKILALVLALCMVFALCACGQAAAPAAAPAEAPAEEAAAPAEEAAAPAEEAAPAAAEYKLGMGVSVSTDSTKDGLAQVDATFAAVVTDANGVIVAVRLDCAQNKMDVSAGVCDPAKAFESKMELGDAYNMKTYGNSIGEWYDEAKGFEAYCVGKTATEIAGMELVVNEEGHHVSTDEALLATCTISVEAFIEAVVKACDDAWAVSFESDGNFTVGAACKSTADESTDPTDDTAGVVKMYTEFGAAVIDADGVVLAALNDAIQPQIGFDKAGAIGDVKFVGTKRELGDNYNMVKYGAAIAEWDAQSAAFSAYCTGMTAAEIMALETQVNEEGHEVSVDDALLAQCTMSIGGMMAVIATAAEYAR